MWSVVRLLRRKIRGPELPARWGPGSRSLKSPSPLRTPSAASPFEHFTLHSFPFLFNYRSVWTYIYIYVFCVFGSQNFSSFTSRSSRVPSKTMPWRVTTEVSFCLRLPILHSVRFCTSMTEDPSQEGSK